MKGTRKAGDFCWVNMLTPDPARARAFFGDLLGWTYVEMPGVGHMVQVGGHSVGGLFDLAGPSTPPGKPPLIGVMVKVESADATVEKATSLGGRARTAFDIADQGRMSVCFDPTGAELDVWEPRKLPGTDVDSEQHGAPSWFEAMTTDADRAASFYAALFGWTTEATPVRDWTYTTFKLDGAPVAGMMPITPRMAALRPQWVTYFTVRDAAEAARQAVDLGGTISRQLHEAAGGRVLCGITSPQGVPFCVAQYAR
jgi:uncharacterized protein